MGLTVTAKNSVHNFPMSYGGFNRMRSKIANVYDQEFGKLYHELQTIYEDNEKDQHIEKINNLLKNPRFKNDDDILDFFFASDLKGSITPKTCSKIYNIIKDHDFGSSTFTYTAFSDGKDYEHLKIFLKDCARNNKKMHWR